MANVEINDLANKATPLSTDEIEIQATGGGTSNKATLANAVQKILLELGQVPFPATQVPSADPNTLDDYEEGTWTPVIGGAGGTSGQSYSAQFGVYTKIGNRVTCDFTLAMTAKGTITGNLELQGLPFATSASGLYRASLLIANQNAITLTAGHILQGMAANNVSVCALFETDYSGDVSAAITTAAVANTTQLYGSITYTV